MIQAEEYLNNNDWNIDKVLKVIKDMNPNIDNNNIGKLDFINFCSVFDTRKFTVVNILAVTLVSLVIL